MRIFTTLPQEDLRKVGPAARAIEAVGYTGVSTQENKHEPFLSLAVAGAATERLELHTGVAIAFARSPMAVANIGWDLAASYGGGRVTIGLGSQVRAHNERRFSVPWSPPAPRIREYVQAVRAIWNAWKSGGKLAYEGKHYAFTLMTPNFVPEPYEGSLPRLGVAAVGPAMLKVAAEESDDVKLHAFCTRKYLTESIMPILDAGLAARGRTRESFEISGGGFVVTGKDDAAVAELFDWVRYRVAFYGSTPAYWPVFEAHGLGDLGRKLNAMTRAGQWNEMAREVSDDVVHLFAAVGRHDQLEKAISRRFGGLVDSISASANSAKPSDLPPDLVQDLARIPTRYKHQA
ncbi:TIGR03617 family F420-dependent LLM class oxidoreductase [Reyranella sp.]|uniref:TIGR03617 family F420-dependent LLM class oxidoreductase n=1 Tax=Reyranella sp. TaxID=1929291 RepID=UPI003D12038B